ncbi:MAG: hypothetical protein UU64_C0003G0073 [candidate division WWE3 bacterium GW2011_GWF2_41_45]|uniref:Uncharacterized protein n=1 Tax=candidate division WWE3 bacterium RIFOXYB1_FULL_42_27 TaxID=1802638 RepID=A0A1F4W2A6_UNCKA|nr:MAG: hypothetical protein UU64_C0003G0073 [candidate division WWE3 bacterium GW2011_GWF2_41_45]KKS20241.1 MAG: hypothetical protein UU79_C0002G0007 [candidate division WWE3 bacterium GW2011_GWE1_41_72]KKS50997.1 MAG: hypothetical protein UV16_C0003G0007 [candidate division WWE3 bacterium GW2011_GWE2_42_25]KKS59475.1 MAG: hypothetical protein UV25_C0026G0007 [candidate division WWE3 bacterium GW2011_GWB1_42_41]KKS60402.1 MAG: hypothetical protein UV27_C0013G0007 [candidate division WWE3 bacte
MKKIFKLVFFLLLLGAVYWAANNWDFVKRTLVKVIPQTGSLLEITENTPSGKITSASFEDCKVSITDISGERYFIGKLSTKADSAKTCAKGSRFTISDSGKYLVFEDLSGGVDLWIRIYSIDKNIINTLAVWGTNNLLDIEFLSNDKLMLFSGHSDIPDEQQLKLFDVPGIYANYSLISDTNRLRTDKYEGNLDVRNVSGDFFDVVEIGDKVSVFGGTKLRPILRAEFSVSDL